MNGNAKGFTLVEVIVALFLIAVGVIATAPLFVYATQETAGGGDFGIAGAAAVRRLELLRGTPYALLPTGGSLTANVSGFVDSSDPEVVVRWQTVINPNPPALTKVIRVRAEVVGESIGERKDVTLITVRGL